MTQYSRRFSIVVKTILKHVIDHAFLCTLSSLHLKSPHPPPLPYPRNYIMNIAGLSAGVSLILIGVFAFMDYSSFSIESWRTLFFALTMVIAGSIGIVVEFYPFKFLDTWFKLVTCWPGKALYYLFWGLITWDYSNSEIISNGDKWKVRKKGTA